MERKGFFGEFGGSFVDETCQKVLDELSKAFEEAQNDEDFVNEYLQLLKDYVGRPSPLYFAKNLSKIYHTNIYLKREDLNHTGSHKINNAIGQVLLAKRMGKTCIVAETGAGQHGVATATVCALMGMKCKIFMGKTDIERQRPNVEKIILLGAELISVDKGTATLSDAVDEALRYWVNSQKDTFYLLGSAVGPHPYPTIVAYFQSIISREIKNQLQQKNIQANHIVACVGGGSNATGAFYHFIDQTNVSLIAVEAGGKGSACGQNAASMNFGEVDIIHGYKSLVLKDQNGNIANAYSISAGLDYPGVSPLLAHLATTKRLNTVIVDDIEAQNAAKLLIKSEGIIPAIESAHALGVLDKIKFSTSENVIINLSGRGDKDMELYGEFLNSRF